MSGERGISRRGAVAGLLSFGLGAATARAQGFAGLGRDAGGFAPVVPGAILTFPADHGAHPEFRIEWWYLTANLRDTNGVAYGVQWTLFRQAMRPGPQLEGWANQQIWMGHAAATRAGAHRSAEIFARGGVGQAGVEATPFRAWIDAWQIRGEGAADVSLSPLTVQASAADFSYTLKLAADRPVVLQGEAGYSRKSERGQASYYYSQPWFSATGTLSIDGRAVDVSGEAWMDREWSSQPLASDQTGWDWFSLHLDSGDKLMLFRLRQAEGAAYFAGNFIGRDGRSVAIPATGITMTPLASTDVAGRKLPTSWRIEVAERGLAIETSALNPQSWMATSFPYWEGPILVRGSQRGVGYLEMTGY